MSSDTRVVLPNPHPSDQWAKEDIELAIKCIRVVHRHGRVLSLWELALQIEQENKKTNKTVIGNTIYIIHQRIVDLFYRFQSCIESIVRPSDRWQPSDHDFISAETAPYSLREKLLQKLEWFYELYAVVGKPNIMSYKLR